MKVLAIGLMMWMQANCSVPGVNPEHNFCDLNWDHPVPKIVLRCASPHALRKVEISA